MTESRCPECGADWNDGKTCRDHFDQMLAWEFEDPVGAGAKHHLTVLCYHLQHPSLYSPEGLEYGKNLLVRFLDGGIPPGEMRKQIRDQVNSSTRKWKIKGTPDAYGSYEHPIEWTLAAADVTTGGPTDYCERVKAWAWSVYEALKESGNLEAAQTSP
jgi:hypothetical protein